MNKDLALYRLALHSSAADYDRTAHLVTDPAPMGWTSQSSGEEWLLIDLGALSKIDAVRITWGDGFAGLCRIQLSAEGETWQDAALAKGAANASVETPVTGEARFVRLLCEDCSGEHYDILRVEVFGENDLSYALPPMPAPEEDGSQALTGGSWRILRAEQVADDGPALSLPSYTADHWLPATVPGTALVSYLKAGAVPDPDFDDYQFQISEAYFTADFWYRNTFPVPADRAGQRVYLDFDAINWKADIFFNGTFLPNALAHRKHSIEGAFIRSRFDVTDLVRFGEDNGLAVRIYKNETPGEVTSQGLAEGPGPNGGLLGADNPTIHAAVGWDWLPTIRGRDIGIYGDVYLRYSGPATLVDPWMETRLSMLSESSANPTEDLMQGSGVTVDGKPGLLSHWQGLQGDSFVVDLQEERTLGSVTLIWGTEAVGGAADLESRYPQSFRLERSKDGEHWENFDAYPGGKVELPWIGLTPAPAIPGHESLEGHSISDSVQGATAIVPIDLSFFGRGIIERPVFAPEKARYLRFTVLQRRHLGGQAVDTRVREMRIYEQSPEQVEQGMKHDYVLDASKADLLFRTEIQNHEGRPVTGTLTVTVQPGGLTAEVPVVLKPLETRPVELSLVMDAPRLWWPNTYGEPFLYTCTASLALDGKSNDKKQFRFGVRRFDYPIDGGLLTLCCNGTRILCKGGNWGLDDGLKRDTRRVLFDKVRLHAEENMNMIRNWVGMTGHPAFYDACDRYGILIWDDFWLANPFDGPEPNDNDLFLENAADKIKAVRGHASLALYCGRNEGNPNEIINEGLKKLTDTLDGTHLYVPHSADAPVGSGGGYSLAMPGGEKGIKQYFHDVSSTVIRSERGIPNVPELSSLKRFLKPENLWPISESWALHDWTYHSNGPANSYMHAVNSYLGGDLVVPVDKMNPFAKNNDELMIEYKKQVYAMDQQAARLWTVEDFCRAAQLINFDNHRGMFDALSSRRTGGLLMWMSQSSWPSFMWQTYDFYLDVNGGYFGCKAGCQPTRALFDPTTDGILLANATPNRYEQVKTLVELYNLDGSLADRQSFDTEVLEPDAYGIALPGPRFDKAASDVVFLRLTLLDQDGTVLGTNTYWHDHKVYQDYRALSTLPKASVQMQSCETEASEPGYRRFEVHLQNGPTPAVGVRVRLLDEAGRPVLPAFCSDNYLTLMPEESFVLTVECHADQAAGGVSFAVEGWNV